MLQQMAVSKNTSKSNMQAKVNKMLTMFKNYEGLNKNIIKIEKLFGNQK